MQQTTTLDQKLFNARQDGAPPLEYLVLSAMARGQRADADLVAVWRSELPALADRPGTNACLPKLARALGLHAGTMCLFARAHNIRKSELRGLSAAKFLDRLAKIAKTTPTTATPAATTATRPTAAPGKSVSALQTYETLAASRDSVAAGKFFEAHRPAILGELEAKRRG